jgi:hypothetical protein
MTQVSRPMQIVLLVTVLFGAVWLVALRPKPAGQGGAPAPAASQAPDAPGAKGLTTAIDKAQGAVDTADKAGQKAAGEEPATTTPAPAATSDKTGGATTPAHKTAPAKARHAARTHHRSRAAKQHAGRVRRANAAHVRAVRVALRHHKAVAIAFVSPQIADARAVAVEIRHVSSFHGRALVLAVPVGQLSHYDFITLDVQVASAPTTVIVDRRGRATTIVGFADRVEIQQRLADALAVKPR